MLRSAVHGAAYANFAQKTGRKDVAIMAMSFYRSSLSIMNQALTDAETSITEATMTTVVLLSLYEVSAESPY